jgi:hypothetical protein
MKERMSVVEVDSVAEVDSVGDGEEEEGRSTLPPIEFASVNSEVEGTVEGASS